MFHLTARVAWHDMVWNGRVCREPSCNAFCAALERIRKERDDKAEDQIAGKQWCKLKPRELPVCKAESGAFMSPEEISIKDLSVVTCNIPSFAPLLRED
jgi:hypothetical protein